jgi:DNA-binding transcriptional regulator YhcF (GntR family)
MAPDAPEVPAADQSQSAYSDPRRQLLENTLGAQYEILRLLGQGGVGMVYLARERLLERLVAIKVLRSEFVSADTKERFVREARTAAKLMHAHIVPLYSFGQAGDTLYYIMGYVEGESLESLIQRSGRIDAIETRRILVEVADALDYAHRNGVVHRDVKPDNILIERESRRAILTDFGIAKLAATQSTLTQTGMIVGTPLYMSPEQAAGDSLIDGRTDLYSLGVIGYRMVSGKLPIEGSSAQDVMRRHVMQEPQPLSTAAPTAPMDLAWAITRCLDKEPSRRWPTAEAFRQALESEDAAVGELPEALEHLSGLAGVAVWAAWALAVASGLAWAATGQKLWIWTAAALPLLAFGALLPLYFNAKRFGLEGMRAWRLLAAPPERWKGFWPSRLRRPGDVWEQLPVAIRQYRAHRTITLLSVLGVVAPIALGLMLRGRPATQMTTLVLTAFVGFQIVLLLIFRSAAAKALGSRAVHERAMRKWLSEPTWNSGFWRRPEVVGVLAAPKVAETAIDSPSADPYCITTPTQPELPQGMFDHVDPRSPTPLYAQIASRLRVAIASGELRPGDGLPSVRQLSGKLRINPATVVQAYRELEVEGLVSTRQGAGTFVQNVAIDRRTKDREHEARRLVRDLLAEAAGLGITSTELRSAMEQELKSSDGRSGGSR